MNTEHPPHLTGKTSQSSKNFSRLDYASCTVEELRRFQLDRHVQVDVQASRAALEGALVDQDAQDTSDFYRHPAELRHVVYEELLVDKRDLSLRESGQCMSQARYETRCHPQILAASRQTFKEAASIFTARTLLTSFYHRSQSTMIRSHWPEIRANIGGRIAVEEGLLDYTQIKRYIANSRIATFRNLHVSIHMADEGLSLTSRPHEAFHMPLGPCD